MARCTPMLGVPRWDGGTLCAYAAGPAHPFVRRRVSLRGVAASRLPRPTITAWDCLLPQSPWRALGSSECSRSLPIADALEIYGSRRLMLLTETPSRKRRALHMKPNIRGGCLVGALGEV